MTISPSLPKFQGIYIAKQKYADIPVTLEIKTDSSRPDDELTFAEWFWDAPPAPEIETFGTILERAEWKKRKNTADVTRLNSPLVAEVVQAVRDFAKSQSGDDAITLKSKLLTALEAARQNPVMASSCQKLIEGLNDNFSKLVIRIREEGTTAEYSATRMFDGIPIKPGLPAEDGLRESLAPRWLQWLRG